MEEFLQQLDINPNVDIDELPMQFARVLSFMNIDQNSEPSGLEVRMFLRATLFLYGNLELHGPVLEQKLKDFQHIPKNELNTLLAKFHEGILLTDVCEKLLLTISGPSYLLEIQDFCNDFLDPKSYMAVLQKVQEVRQSDSNEDPLSTEAKFLVTNIFQLQSEKEIDLAIDRILNTVEFGVLACIIHFNESHTYLAMKYLIVQNAICSFLEDGLINQKFIASMFELSAQDDDGFSIYLKCLHNNQFARSLIVFSINHLNAVNDTDTNPENSKWLKYDRNHVSFLIAGMLSYKSPCRLEFHKKLAATSVNIDVLLSISHLNFIYNF